MSGSLWEQPGAARAAAAIEDERRGPRLSVQCRVVVRGRVEAWTAETEDVGPGGCQLVARRHDDVGARVAMSIASLCVPRPLVAAGRVVWVVPGAATARVGVAFDGGAGPPGALAPADWFTRLFAGSPGATVRDGLRSVASGATVYLAAPPPAPPPLRREQVRLLRRIGGGVRVDELRAAAGASGFERALFTLLSRRCLTLVRAAAVPFSAWARLVDAAEAALANEELAASAGSSSPAAARPPPARAAPARRSAEAQRLYERGVELLVAGNAEQAGRLFQAAAAAAPGDAVLRGVLARFATT